MLLKNNYPRNLSKLQQQNHQRQVNEEVTKYISVPYIKGCSERVQRILHPHQIRLANKPSTTIRSQVCHLKDAKSASERNHAVYKIDCLDCSSTYIGETSKIVGDRVKEHRRNIVIGNA